MAKIPSGVRSQDDVVIAIANALNQHFGEFASDARMTDARLHALEHNVKALNEKLDHLLEQLSPQAIPKRDLRKPSAGGAS